MKRFFTTAALVAGLVGIAGGAIAASPDYCNRVAQNAVDKYTHPVGSAAIGRGAGAIVGSLLFHGKAGGVAGGCAVGAGGGIVVSSSKQQRIYNEAYNNCMNSGYAPPPPAPTPYPVNWTHSAITPYGSSSNVRSGPGTTFPIVDQLPAGTPVGVSFCNNGGWCKIGQDQWMSQSLLSFR